MKSAEEIIEIINSQVKREEEMCIGLAERSRNEDANEHMGKIIMLNSILKKIQEN